MTQTLNNVNFQLLLKAHGGNLERAMTAWQKICALGGYGDVPATYQGGLDVEGIRIARDEFDHGGNPEFARTGALDCAELQIPLPTPLPPMADDIKRIEDLAVGNNPE